MSDLQIVPTGGALGAEIRGFDLSRPLSARQIDAVKTAFLGHCVLFFRNQTLSEIDQVRFSRYFGHPVPHVREQPDRPIPEIFVISNVDVDGKPIGALGNEEIPFHSDLSYLPRPGSISILYAVEVPETGGDTSWANGYAAYEALAPEQKISLAGLLAIHLHPRPQQNPPAPVAHPIVRIHPETGRRVLYVNPYFTRRVVGLPEKKSRSLVARLCRHATQRQFIWTHVWRPGDLLMWDNRCTMHRRDAFDNRYRRIMKRTQMLGDEPYGVTDG